MGIEGIGSSVVIALAAVLWLVYLIPTWFRRREYLSTERNAVRLQQTLRIMAETAEVPETVHIESTARNVAAQQKLLRQEFERQRSIERAKEAAMSRAATRTLASLKPTVASGVVTHSTAAIRLRRSRAATSAVLLLSLVAIVVGLTPMLADVSATVIALGSTISVGAFALLSKMAAVARARAGVARGLAARRPAERTNVAREQATEATKSQEGWTPVPVPKPLYLSKPPVQQVVSDASIAEAHARLLAEAEEEKRMLREAERAEKVTPIRPAAASDSRFARMGIVDHSDNTVTDLDAALRRRRAV